MVRATLLGIASAILLPLSLPAQLGPTEGSPPLEITVRPTETQIVDPNTHSSTRLPAVAVEIRNVSEKCVVAISLSTKDRDSEGKVIATGGATFFRQHNSKFNCLEPGETFSSTNLGSAIDASGNPAKTDVTLDFVIFGDGSTWGPGNDAEQKGYLRGKFDAYKHMQSQRDKQRCDDPMPTSEP